MGTTVRWRGWRRWSGAFVVGASLWSVAVDSVIAQDHYTLLVTGASGGTGFQTQFDEWRATLVTALRNQPTFDDDHLVVLTETPGPGVGRASADGVRQALDKFAQRAMYDAVLYVVLIGHGSFDGVDAKFNLVGPDLEAAAWRTLLDGIPGQVVVVNTTSASFPFLSRLSGPNRIVVTATESTVQRYDTVFPQFFVEAFADLSADRDKNGRVSLLEAFDFASARVRQWYQQHGRLATERALLDDNGDGRGREAGQPGPDGSIAARLHLGAGSETPSLRADPLLRPLVTQRQILMRAIRDLLAVKSQMAEFDYLREVERLLVDLARVSREIRVRSRS